MPDIKCLSPELRNDVKELLRKSGAPRKDIALFDAVPDCDSGVIELGRVRGGGGTKRAPSAYNLFIGDCMRGTNKNLKTCATEWREQKGK